MLMIEKARAAAESALRRRDPMRLLLILGALQLLVVVSIVLLQPETGMPPRAAGVLVVFLAALWCWICTPLDDTWVALAAGTTVVLLGLAEPDRLFAALGDDTVWLLIASFVLAAGVASSGLALRMTRALVRRSRTPRALFHAATLAVAATAFLVPSTTGRAALAVPVLVALAAALRDHRRLVVALAVLFPTVILLSAVASLVGAGAHLVTAQLVADATGRQFDFLGWLILGLPFALVSSHLAAELVLRLFTEQSDRRVRLVELAGALDADAPESDDPAPGRGLRGAQLRVVLILGGVVLLWLSEPIHGLPPTLVALVGALVSTLPVIGTTRLRDAVSSIPWSLLLFLAATLALGSALVESGASEWLARGAFAPLAGLPGAGALFVVLVTVVSVASHLLIPSRTARSAALIPVVIASAPAFGLDPAAMAFLSTAAAGFCHTLPSSAKPIAVFSDIPGVPTYGAGDLARLSQFLAPLMVLLLLVFAVLVWPQLGLPLAP